MKKKLETWSGTRFFLFYYEKNDLVDKNCTILLSHDKENKWNMYRYLNPSRKQQCGALYAYGRIK